MQKGLVTHNLDIMIQNQKLHECSAEEIAAFQNERIAETLAYVEEHSPYYKELFKKNNIDIKSVKTIADLQKIPVTTKQDLQLRSWDFLC